MLRTEVRVVHALVLSLGLSIGETACHELISPSPVLGAGQQSSGTYDTPVGAQQQAIGVRGMFSRAAVAAMLMPMSDELVRTVISPGGVNLVSEVSVDRRADNAGFSGTDRSTPYGQLQLTRVNANLAQAALDKYRNDTPAPLRGEMLAVQGYMELFLADQYCSGIPLSTVDFEGNFTFQPGSSTAEVYQHATTLFADAASLTTVSDSVGTLARVGWGRALLSRGLYDSAAHVVAGVSTTETYAVRRQARASLNAYSIADREGVHGQPYQSAHDPRVPTQSTFAYQTNSIGQIIAQIRAYLPAGDYGVDSVSVPVASGIEARLIEAEAQLQHVLTTHSTGDISAWLQTLNTLRTTGTSDGTDSLFQVDSVGFDFGSFTPIYDSTFIRIDTLWHPGTGGIVGLGMLDDPGAGLSGAAADSARVDLMFHERAFWLFLHGQRQGDMRRLIRQYHRTQAQVFPTGVYPIGGTYGSAVNLPIKDDGNPLFKGCINRGA